MWSESVARKRSSAINSKSLAVIATNLTWLRVTVQPFNLDVIAHVLYRLIWLLDMLRSAKNGLIHISREQSTKIRQLHIVLRVGVDAMNWAGFIKNSSSHWKRLKFESSKISDFRFVLWLQAQLCHRKRNQLFSASCHIN